MQDITNPGNCIHLKHIYSAPKVKSAGYLPPVFLPILWNLEEKAPTAANPYRTEHHQQENQGWTFLATLSSLEQESHIRLASILLMLCKTIRSGCFSRPLEVALVFSGWDYSIVVIYYVCVFILLHLPSSLITVLKSVSHSNFDMIGMK